MIEFTKRAFAIVLMIATILCLTMTLPASAADHFTIDNNDAIATLVTHVVGDHADVRVIRSQTPYFTIGNNDAIAKTLVTHVVVDHADVGVIRSQTPYFTIGNNDAIAKTLVTHVVVDHADVRVIRSQAPYMNVRTTMTHCDLARLKHVETLKRWANEIRTN